MEWDDPNYVTENVHVRSGLSARGIVWALTSTEFANWHPVTWLSHMLDVSLFGLSPWGHHLTSLLLHLANTLLLFFALRRLTGARWRSLAVAALFALHPLHVESVAWVSERKDVLSTAFWFAALWAFARYAERPSRARYALVTLLFGLGLMAKPMLVSLPLTLLLLDAWPLRRAGEGKLSQWRPLVVEKLPWFAMSLAASVMTWLAQRHYGAVVDSQLPSRFAGAVLGYSGYLEKTLWPAGLAAFYPHRPHPPVVEVAVKAGVLLLLTAAAWWARRQRPALLVGWLWYLVTLVPVIGLVRVGQQQMADRYTYVPLVGVFVMLAWAAGDQGTRWSRHAAGRVAVGVAAVVVAVALALGTSVQVQSWRDGVTLWERSLALGGNSPVSQNNLAVALEKAGRIEEAAAHYREAIRLEPRHIRAHFNLGNLRFQQGRYAEAIPPFEQALRLDPDDEQTRRVLATTHFNIANSLWRQANRDEAVREYRAAIRYRPEDAGFERALGMVLLEQGRHEEAAAALVRSVELDPTNADTHGVLAIARFRLGDDAGAWREVRASRSRGGSPAPWLLTELSRRTPEPH